MGISFGSINTGLPKDIVKQLIAAERIPLEKMAVKKGKFENKKKLVGELSQLVEDLRGQVLQNKSSRSLRELQVNTNENILGVSLDKNIANPSNHQIEVIQLAQKSSAMSSGFASRTDSYVGVGYIQYQMQNGETRDVYVDSSHSSLDGIAKLINQDTENGMSASVIDDGSGTDRPFKLILSAEETGDNSKVNFPYFYFVDGEDDFFLESEREAHDAKIKLDGFEIELPSNKVKDVIPGVTLDLRRAKPGEEFGLTISENSEAITSKITELVTKLNAIFMFVKSQNKLDEKSDTSQTLGGDILLQSLEGRLRSVVFKGIETDFGAKRFGDLGVSFQRDGSVKLDEDKFNSITSDNYKLVAQVLTGVFSKEGKTPGFMDHLDEAVKLVLRMPDGLLYSRKRGLQSRIDQIDRRITDRERMIKQKEQNLKNKFSRLEGTISQIKSQGAGIAGMSGPSPVQQLG